MMVEFGAVGGLVVIEGKILYIHGWARPGKKTKTSRSANEEGKIESQQGNISKSKILPYL